VGVFLARRSVQHLVFFTDICRSRGETMEYRNIIC
jgi:hypothetical protein